MSVNVYVVLVQDGDKVIDVEVYASQSDAMERLRQSPPEESLVIWQTPILGIARASETVKIRALRDAG